MYKVGIDIGGMSAKLGFISGESVLKKEVIPTNSNLNYEVFINDLCESIKQFCKLGEIAAVGISSCGIINSKKGSIVYSNNIKWENKDIVSDISNTVNLPVRIANDAKCAALAEAVYGAGREYNRVCMVTIGTGVGGGFIVNKNLDSGSPYSDADSILGHLTVENNGRQCTCGRKGCLEAYSSATAVMQEYKDKTGEDLPAGDIFKKSKEGCQEAVEVINDFTYYLSEGLTTITNILRPELIVIGGGVTESANQFLDQLNEYVNSNIFGGMLLPIKIVKAELGNNAGMIGATLIK